MNALLNVSNVNFLVFILNSVYWNNFPRELGSLVFNRMSDLLFCMLLGLDS